MVEVPEVGGVVAGDRKLVAAAIIVPLLILLVGMLLLFGTPASKNSSLVAAAFTFCGAVVTAWVSMIGLVLKKLADARLERERELAEARLEREHQDESNRLRLDAAMRAGQLLASDATHPPAPAVVASGLLVLTRLDQVGLAVTLLVDLWTEENPRISSEAAILVIDAALRSTTPTTQLVAAEILCRNATRLDPCQSLHWPSSLEGRWNPDFSGRTKLLIIEALADMMLTAPANEAALRAVAVRLYAVWDAEIGDDRVRGCVGKLLKALLPQLELLGYCNFMHGNREVRLEQLIAAGSSAHANPDGFLDQLSTRLAKQLSTWSLTCGGLPQNPGSLAAAYCGTPLPLPEQTS